jgi:hypothetical protein
MLGWIGWVIAFYCVWEVGNRRRWAWLVNISAEFFLVAHGVNTGDWSLVAAAILWACMCIRNYMKWTPDAVHS